MVSGPDFRESGLWKRAFVLPRNDASAAEQLFFSENLLAMRERVRQLVSRIPVDMAGITVHDLSHIDALWDLASLIAAESMDVNPAEGFVLGAAFLLHDAAMSVGAYPGGLAEIMTTVEWKDAITRAAIGTDSREPDFDPSDPPAAVVEVVLPDVLRRLHAKQAGAIVEQGWRTADGGEIHLISEPEVRFFCGPTIGDVAHSHWWPIQQVETEFVQELGAFAPRTRNAVDRLKAACLLRAADAIHLDQRRAPRFLRALVRPKDISALHWTFQERLARPTVDSDALVFTTGQPFDRRDADAWWLAFDTITAADRELRQVDLLLRSQNREGLRVRRIKGAGSPEALSHTVRTRSWRPIDARVQVSDVPRIVATLGGTKLYGNDPTVPVKELIQNAADAVEARRRLRRRSSDWGEITVTLEHRDTHWWLSVEDNGIGMSEQVMTGPLLDFGVSFWTSSLASDEFPGLIANGMRAVGRFGIGFFSVFMLGDVIRVTSRRFDRGVNEARVLEFSGGLSARPILSEAPPGEVPVDGGTRVDVRLKADPRGTGGLLYAGAGPSGPERLARRIAALAPSLQVKLSTVENGLLESVINPGDWLRMSEADLLARVEMTSPQKPIRTPSRTRKRVRPLVDQNGKVFGRATIGADEYWAGRGTLTVGGLRVAPARNIRGILLGDVLTAARNTALPLVPPAVLAKWATEQAILATEQVGDGAAQARCAEVVLGCGGDPGNLAFAYRGEAWLTPTELLQVATEEEEWLVHFGGEFDYDEEVDPVIPKQFRDNFEIDAEIIIVPRHDATILAMDGQPWPRVSASSSHETNLEREIKKIFRGARAKELFEAQEKRPVGTVLGTSIEREVTVFNWYED